MSKKNNVNPDHNKLRGRDRVNEDIVGGKGAPARPEPRGKRRPAPPAPSASDRAARNRRTENPT